MAARTKLTIAYLGDGFSGWQSQMRQRTVQGDLEVALAKITDSDRVVVVGAGRTDAGVHAVAQTAHVDLPVEIPPQALPSLLNARLEPDLRVRSARTVPAGFHAQKSALGKHYAYRIRWREPGLPWLGLRTAVMPKPSNTEAMNEACSLLPGRRDWASFTVPKAALRGAVRTVYRVEMVWRRDGLDLHVVGTGFLRYQVRRMVGALFNIGRGRLAINDLLDLLDSPSPGAPLFTTPARGLSLERVYYRAAPRLSTAAESGPSLW